MKSNRFRTNGLAPSVTSSVARILCSFIILCLGANLGLADAGSKPKTVRLLAVGNSFAHNATRYIGQLAEASGNRLILEKAALGGCSLEKHWKGVERFEAAPDALESKIYPHGENQPKLALLDFLQAEKWDFVTIQQASPISDNPATYMPYARQLRDYVKKHAPNAEVLFHQTWAYRADHPRFKDGLSDPYKMHEAVRQAYVLNAKELGLRIIPVGEAFHKTLALPEWKLVPDTGFEKSNPIFPNIPPPQYKLHKGWTWKVSPGKEPKLHFDGFHANDRGEYLGSCVFYEVIFEESIVGNPFVPKGITPAEAATLQQMAHEAVAAEAQSHSLQTMER